MWNTRSWEEVGGSPTGTDRAADLVWSHSGERIAVGFDDVLVFELGDLGSPPGATNEPRSISDDQLPAAIGAPEESAPASVAPSAPIPPAGSTAPAAPAPVAAPAAPAAPKPVPAPAPPASTKPSSSSTKSKSYNTGR